MSVCYPKTPVGGVGVGEHTDQGFLTILNQDMVGGLEVKVDDKWIKVVPEEGTLVINIGDMMEKFTNKVVSLVTFSYVKSRLIYEIFRTKIPDSLVYSIKRATPHRVTNTADCERFSWPFFFDPTWNAVIENSGRKYSDCVLEAYDSYFPERKNLNKSLEKYVNQKITLSFRILIYIFKRWFD